MFLFPFNGMWLNGISSTMSFTHFLPTMAYFCLCYRRLFPKNMPTFTAHRLFFEQEHTLLLFSNSVFTSSMSIEQGIRAFPIQDQLPKHFCNYFLVKLYSLLKMVLFRWWCSVTLNNVFLLVIFQSNLICNFSNHQEQAFNSWLASCWNASWSQ